jgi:hypothetical protein
MPGKPSYKELEQRVQEIGQADSEHKKTKKAFNDGGFYRAIIHLLE